MSTPPTTVITWTTCPDCQLRFDAALVPGGICPRCMLASSDADDPRGSSSPQAPWQPPSAAELQPMLPDYELIELIGRGGMGAVYRARQPSLDRLVAIKLLPAETAEMAAGFTERFKNEARLLARMNHPGIVHVYDFGTLVDGSCYIVMEYVDGSDVARMVAASGKLPPEHAASITADVCAALHYAHEAGIVHRDIKPGNILVTRQGQVKVADFGLAKQRNIAQPPMTQTGMTMGTPEFLAPESMLAGMVVDHRADLYAVGVMLYNMLTGQIPRGVFKPASETVAAAPAFDDIIQKAMQADPEQRYQTAHALKSDVQSAIQSKPTPRATTWRWAAMVATAACLAVVAAVTQHPLVTPVNPPIQPSIVAPARPPVQPATTLAPSTAGDIRVDNSAGNALTIFSTVQGFGTSPEAITTLSPPGLSSVKAIAVGAYHNVILRHDRSVLVWGSNKSDQCRMPPGLDNVVAIGAGCYASHSLAVRADGSVVAWGANGQGQCDVPSGLTDVIAVSAGRMHSMALKKDGTVVAWGGNFSSASKVPAGLSDAIAISAGGLFSVALKKDGSVVAWGLNRVGQTDVPESAMSGVTAISAGSEHVLALKKDGSVIAWGHNNLGQAEVPDAAKGGVVAIAAGILHSLALKSDGSVIAWGGKDGPTVTPPRDFRALAISTGWSHAFGIVQRAEPLVFEDQPTGSSMVKSIKVRNQGNGILSTIMPSLIGADAAEFALDATDYSASLAAGGSYPLSVTFHPISAGAKTAVLRIPSNDADTPYFDIPLKGISITKTAIAAPSPAPAAARADMSDDAINAMFRQLQQDNPGLPLLTTASESSGVLRVERKPDELVLRLGNLPELKNISALEGSAFTHLGFRNSPVTDFRVLRTMKQLRSLFLDLPEGTDCEQFRGLHLQEIIASRVASLEPFAGPQLSIIQVTSPVKNLTFLSRCPNLKTLSLWESSVEDLSPLRELPLESLTLPNTKVQSLEPLRGKPLTAIDIRGCPVTDLSPLLDNPELKELQCDQGTFNADSLKAHLGK